MTTVEVLEDIDNFLVEQIIIKGFKYAEDDFVLIANNERNLWPGIKYEQDWNYGNKVFAYF